jgi:hypothetical protein
MLGRDLNINRSKALENTLTDLARDAINEKEFSSEYSPETIANSILYTFRGIAYCWAIGTDQFDLKAALQFELSRVLDYYSLAA